jgi:hypothetical protein
LDAFRKHCLACTETITDFKCPLGKTDRAAAESNTFLIVQDNDWNAALTEVKRGGKPDGSTATDYDRTPHW